MYEFSKRQIQELRATFNKITKIDEEKNIQLLTLMHLMPTEQLKQLQLERVNILSDLAEGQLVQRF